MDMLHGMQCMPHAVGVAIALRPPPSARCCCILIVQPGSKEVHAACSTCMQGVHAVHACTHAWVTSSSKPIVSAHLHVNRVLVEALQQAARRHVHVKVLDVLVQHAREVQLAQAVGLPVADPHEEPVA